MKAKIKLVASIYVLRTIRRNLARFANEWASSTALYLLLSIMICVFAFAYYDSTCVPVSYSVRGGGFCCQTSSWLTCAMMRQLRYKNSPSSSSTTYVLLRLLIFENSKTNLSRIPSALKNFQKIHHIV